MPELTDAAGFIEVLRGHVYEPIGPQPVVGSVRSGWGTSEDRPRSLSLTFKVGPEEAEVEIEGDAGGWISPSLISSMLLHTRALDDGELTFPLTVTVEKTAGTLSLDGVRHDAVVFSCAERAVAALEIDDVCIEVKAPVGVLPHLLLTKMTEASLASLVEEARNQGRFMGPTDARYA